MTLSPATKAALVFTGAYLAAGFAVAAHTAYLWGNGKPHFEGLGNAGAAMGLAQTVLLWPYAELINLTGKGAA